MGIKNSHHKFESKYHSNNLAILLLNFLMICLVYLFLIVQKFSAISLFIILFIIYIYFIEIIS